jgi:hypothetical protein
MPETVISFSFLDVAQDFIGFRSFLELLFGVLIPFVAVRVILLRQFTVGLLDLIRPCAFANAENLIIVSFCHSSNSDIIK